MVMENKSQENVEKEGKMSADCKMLIEKHIGLIDKFCMLPLFAESLVIGGMKLFDEVRGCLENVGINWEEVDFTRLR